MSLLKKLNISFVAVVALPLLFFYLPSEEKIFKASLQAPVFELEPAVVLSETVKSEISLQDQLDDIAEKLDIIQQQVNELVEGSKPKIEEKIEEVKEIDKIIEIEPIKPEPLENPPAKIVVSSPGRPSYLKVLFSEIQMSPIVERFIELYNPNEKDVSLTDWYLQRKTETADSFSSLVSSTKFEGKTILAQNYFLISRTDQAADIFLDDLTLTENNSFVLKNPNREVSDEINWLKIAENLSWCKEFRSCSPTPKTQNQEWIELALQGSSILETTTPSDLPLLVLPEISMVESVSSKDSPIFLPIVINEIQIEGQTTKDDWVELYNPNDFDVDISEWSIQRSPASGNIYKKNFEAEQKIIAKGYFLIVRNDASQNLLDIADMTCSALQLAEKSTIYLVKDQEEITDGADLDIIDKVGIGEESFAPEGGYALVPSAEKSITRTGGIDTNDNSVDFIIIDTPTPKEP